VARHRWTICDCDVSLDRDHAAAQRIAARGLADGETVRVFNDRGSFVARAGVSEAARPGVTVGLSIWWPKLAPGGRNANAVTSQELTDMGGGATFYDCLVEVEPVGSGEVITR